MYDYDNCTYLIAKDQGSDLLKFGFSCNCSKDLLRYGGEEMLDELYAGKQLRS